MTKLPTSSAEPTISPSERTSEVSHLIELLTKEKNNYTKESPLSKCSDSILKQLEEYAKHKDQISSSDYASLVRKVAKEITRSDASTRRVLTYVFIQELGSKYSGDFCKDLSIYDLHGSV